MRTWLVALLAMAAGCLETGAVMASNPETITSSLSTAGAWRFDGLTCTNTVDIDAPRAAMLEFLR
jgi:hypothetical protein